MAEHFNIAVIGSGPGGYVAALRAACLGASVAVVEQSHLGGTCLNNGCIPSKALLASAELAHRIAHSGSLGVEVSGKVKVNWDKVQQRKDKVLQTLRGGIASLFRARKVKLFEGRGALDGPRRVVVQSDGRPAAELTADSIILAVGSVPSRIPGWPDDPEYVCTSDEALHWKTLPRRLLIVGGGIIGCEFACMLQALGVEVTVVEMLDSLIPGMDAQLAETLEKIFERRGIAVHTATKVEDLTVGEKGVSATLSGGEKVSADRVLVATGRWPNTKDIGLESVGISTDRGFVRVNDAMETSVKGHYCIGDANGRCLLAHAASVQGVTAVANALGNSRTFDAPVPSAVYTFPEIAAVGRTARQCREAQIPFTVGTFPLGHLGKAMAVGEADGFIKVIRHRETDEMLGVHMIGHNVTECIAAATGLMHSKASVRDVAEVVAAHPTIAEAFKEAAEDALYEALHLPPRKVLRVVAGG